MLDITDFNLNIRQPRGCWLSVASIACNYPDVKSLFNILACDIDTKAMLWCWIYTIAAAVAANLKRGKLNRIAAFTFFDKRKF